MTHWKSLFNYDYLGVQCLPEGKDIVLTIKKTDRKEVPNSSGKKEECTILYFEENVKPLVLNKTNCKTMEKLFKTPLIEQWYGGRIQIGSARVNAFGEMVDALRIRPFIPKEKELIPVETNSTVWKDIIDALKSGYKLSTVQGKYRFTKAQIKELINYEIA